MSQTTKDYQYDRNDNNTFGVRGTASGGGTEVVANPTLAGTESALTGLQVGETKYKVEQPINVVANPTLAGTESNLTGLQVGDTKYKVPDGSYTIHTYTEKTYTPSDADYQQLIDDITTGHDIKYDNKIFKLVNTITDYWYYSCFSSTAMNSTYRSYVLLVQKSGNNYIVYQENFYLTPVSANPTLAGTESALTGLQVGTTKYKNQPASVSYLTTAPSSANTDGLKFVVLTSEPATYYNGYYYIIAPTT